MNLLAPLANLFRSPAVRERDAVLESLSRDLKRAEKKLRESYAYADDMVAGWEREREEILNGSMLGGRRGARKDGDNWPYLRNMEDLIRMRQASREACEGNGYGAGMLDRAIDFVVGDGMQHEVTLIGPKKGAVATGIADADGDGRPDADPAVENVEQVIEEFRRLNDWGCGEEDREEEGFRRSQRDGEVGGRFFAGGGDTNGIPYFRWIEPEQVDSPPSAAPNERWGVRHKPGDVETKEAYYVYDLDGTGGEWVDASEVVWHKLGTDRTVLRGVPQFWLVARALYQSDALNSALAEVSAIQAKIAYVREHATGIMPGQITDFVGGTLDGTGVKRTAYGDKYRRTGIQEEGTTVDMSAGMKFTAGPASTGVPAFVQALQSRLRQVCARFGYPEFFTGDASNNNYASSLTAGGPAERAFKRKQHRYASFQAAVYRRACEYAVKADRLSQADLNAVEIKVKPGGVAIANKLEEAQVQQIKIQNKVLSPQSAMVQNGDDPKVEMANIKAWDDQFGMGAMGLGGGGIGGGMGGGEGGGGDGPTFPGLGESYREDQYALLCEADRSHLVRKTITNTNRADTKTRQQVSDAREVASLASDLEAVEALLADGGVSESYTPPDPEPPVPDWWGDEPDADPDGEPAWPDDDEAPLDEPDPEVMESDGSGFTGEKNDRRGRRMCYADGKRVRCAPRPEDANKPHPSARFADNKDHPAYTGTGEAWDKPTWHPAGKTRDGKLRWVHGESGRVVTGDQPKEPSPERKQRAHAERERRLSQPPKAEIPAALGDDAKQRAEAIALVAFGDRGAGAMVSLLRPPAGTTASVVPGWSGNSLSVSLTHPDADMWSRTVAVNPDGTLSVKNNLFFLKPGARGSGMGTKAFAGQVQGMVFEGGKNIHTTAGKGGAGGDRMNGYYTWARLGYDAELEDSYRRKLPEQFKAAKTVQDLMSTKEGTAHWKNTGYMTGMDFDTTPGSRSIQVLNRYLASKGEPPIRDDERVTAIRERAIAERRERVANQPATPPLPKPVLAPPPPPPVVVPDAGEGEARRARYGEFFQSPVGRREDDIGRQVAAALGLDPGEIARAVEDRHLPHRFSSPAAAMTLGYFRALMAAGMNPDDYPRLSRAARSTTGA